MKNIIYTTLIIAILSTSCTKRLDLDLPSSFTRLVVDGGISTDTMVHTIILSKTIDYSANLDEIPYISGANVKITEKESNIVYILDEDTLKKGHYNTKPDFAGRQGVNYHLEISNVDIDNNGEPEIYEADETVPFIADKLDSIKLIYGTSLINEFIGLPNSGLLGWNILMYVQDLSMPQYYEFIEGRNQTVFTDIRNRFYLYDNQFGAQGVYLRGFPIAFLPDSTNKEGTKYKVNIGDTVALYINSLTIEYYTYLQDVKAASSGGNPMMGMPANIRGNISNGAIGYFHAFSSRSAKKVAGQ